jgi:large subunit ribosomal protein L16
MFLKPKITKFAKYHKGKICLKSKNIKYYQLQQGNCGLKALESGRLTAKHLETIRKIIKKIIKKTGKLWINPFPHFSVSSKPNENRMGKGKGKTEYYSSRVISGSIIIELTGVNTRLANKALISASRKLPIRSCYTTLT